MATKVGGFTKSGVVQCVKLVEEENQNLLSDWNGAVSSDYIVCNNGIKFRVLVNGSGSAYFVSRLTLVTAGAYYSILVLNRSGNTVIAHDGGNTNPWESEYSYEISTVGIVFSSSIQASSGSVSCEIITENNTYTYTYTSSGALTGTNFGLSENTNPFTLNASDRMRIPTVRMGKDGTLKCKELIEEEVVDNIDSFAPLQTSSSGSHTFILKNGTYIDLYENDTLVNVTTLGDIDCFQSGTPVLSISSYPNQIGHTTSNSQTE